MKTRVIDTMDLRGGGYAALPDGDGPYPGVVVIHEAYGLNENIKEITRRFADNGYAALAVDLFSGRNRTLCMARYMTGMLIGSVERRGVGELRAGLTHLTAMPEVDPQRVGAIGFCMGGGFAVAWACTDDRLKAIAPFYASNPRPIDAVKRSCPVVGSYPEKDFTASAGRALDNALGKFGIEHDIKIYAGARHSFFNDRGRAHDKQAAQDAWGRVLSFFGKHLGTPNAPAR
ncbi:MAG TPA: dienelactone hydrolase family protein [Candidatus Dormibacteraeota bacterium]|nr:dienelactone hydrolase family protein [Candidatus Dormibacteraeota bacterium]